MLIHADKRNGNNSIYSCDRCNKQISNGEKNLYSVYVRYIKGSPTKQWDLCDRCFKALKKGIEAGGK